MTVVSSVAALMVVADVADAPLLAIVTVVDTLAVVVVAVPAVPAAVVVVVPATIVVAAAAAMLVVVSRRRRCNDCNDNRHGSIMTPRFNYKWSPNDKNTLRLSTGTGYRVVNLFTEDHAATTGSREVVINGTLNPETSYNANLNWQRFINTEFGFINFDASVFYTYFTNKISPDYETNPQQIIYENLDGYAVSQGVSFDLSINFSAPLNIKIGGTFMDVYEMNNDENGDLQSEKQLLTESISGTYGVTYKFNKSNIKIDYSGNVYGPMKLPLVENDTRPAYSDWYSIQNIQITKTFKKHWEVYGGVKNLLNYTPPVYSILRPFDPFDKNVDDPVRNPQGFTFDPSYVYAANQGIRGFFGVRYTFK